MRYDELSENDKIIFNNVDCYINRLLDTGRNNVLRLLCIKYGVKNEN